MANHRSQANGATLGKELCFGSGIGADSIDAFDTHGQFEDGDIVTAVSVVVVWMRNHLFDVNEDATVLVRQSVRTNVDDKAVWCVDLSLVENAVSGGDDGIRVDEGCATKVIAIRLESHADKPRVFANVSVNAVDNATVD